MYEFQNVKNNWQKVSLRKISERIGSWNGGEEAKKTLGPNVPKYVEAVISFVRTVKYERAISLDVWKFRKQTTCLLFYLRFHSFGQAR